MAQQELWHDTIYDALGADVAAAGGFKVVAGKLWPACDPTTGATKLRNALNTDQAQKLDPEEVLTIKRLARDAGSTASVTYESRQLGYRFEWTSPEDEHAKLQREFIEMGKRMQQMLAQLSQTDQRMRAVK